MSHTAARIAHYRELVRSNSDAPTDVRSTISALSTDLARCDVDLARHHTELARLQAQIHRLTAERQILQIHYDDCHSLLAPIRRLPAEILGSIFDLCRYSDDEPNATRLSLGHRNLAQKSLHIISCVCVHWRRIVIGTPAYWTTIGINYGFTIKTPRDLKLLTVALERSRSSPLAVTIYNDELAFRILAGMSEQWKTADVHFGAMDCGLFLRLAGRLPILETFSIRAFPLRLPRSGAPLNFIESAPRLRNLTIVASLMPTTNQPLLRQLSSLTLTSVYPTYIAGCVALMSELSASAELALYLDDKMTVFLRRIAGPDPPVSVPPTTSPLSTLRIRFASVAHLKAILAALTLPGLTALTLRAKYPKIQWPHAEFHALAARSHFSDRLLALDLRGTHISQSELLECLGALPSLERLNIGDRVDGRVQYFLITDDLLRSLTVRNVDDGCTSSQCPAPRLLLLRLFTLGRFDDQVYLDFLRSRMHHLARSGDREQLFESQIEWLWDSLRELSESAMEQIDELRNNGRLRFSISDEDEWEDYWDLMGGDFASDSDSEGD